MIEIEVEMDADVASAELQGAAEGIAVEIARIQGAAPRPGVRHCCVGRGSAGAVLAIGAGLTVGPSGVAAADAESMNQDWMAQAAASDEVERLLRSSDDVPL